MRYQYVVSIWAGSEAHRKRQDRKPLDRVRPSPVSRNVMRRLGRAAIFTGGMTVAAMSASAQTYTTDTSHCVSGAMVGRDYVTLTMADQRSRKYLMTVAKQPGPPVPDQAKPIAPLLQSKVVDPTAPPFDTLGFLHTASPLGWLVLGRSYIGGGCPCVLVGGTGGTRAPFGCT